MSTLIFSEEDKQRIVKAIADAELLTSGEIRVHIAKFCFGDPVAKAFRVFNKLGMNNTAERNGVLIFIASGHRKLAIVGDQGIHQHMQPHFWEQIKEQMLVDFKVSGYADGLIKGIKSAGDALSAYFPVKSNDRDELSNELSFGK